MAASRYCIIHPDSELGNRKFSYTDSWVDVEHQSSKAPRPTKESYKFDRVFTPGSSQERVYNHVAKQAVLDALCNMASAAFIAMGPSGAGKTFLITGGAKRFADRGLIPRSISSLFEGLSARPDGGDFKVSISFFEVYKDNVVDLLTPRGSRVPWPVEGSSSGTGSDENLHSAQYASAPPDLMRCTAETESDAYQLLFHGDSHRHFDMLPRNAETSLSHVFFVVYLFHKPTGKEAVLTFVDLAAEIGTRSHAAMSISWSLNALRVAVAALRDGRTPPFGASLLTRLMKPFLQLGYTSPSYIAYLHPVLLAEAALDEQREWLALASQVRDAMSPPENVHTEGMDNASRLLSSAPALVPPTATSAQAPLPPPLQQVPQQIGTVQQLSPTLDASALVQTSMFAKPVQAGTPNSAQEKFLRLPLQQQQQPHQQILQNKGVDVGALSIPVANLEPSRAVLPIRSTSLGAGLTPPAQIEPQQQPTLKLKSSEWEARVLAPCCCGSGSVPSQNLPDLRGDGDEACKWPEYRNEPTTGATPAPTGLLATGTSLTCSATSLPTMEQVPQRSNVCRGAGEGPRNGISNQPEPEPSGDGSTSEGGASKLRIGSNGFTKQDRVVPVLRQLLPSGAHTVPVARPLLPAAETPVLGVPRRDVSSTTEEAASSNGTNVCGALPLANGVVVDDVRIQAGTSKVPPPVNFNSAVPAASESQWQQVVAAPVAAPSEREEAKQQWRFAAGRSQARQQTVPPPLRLNQGSRLSNCASEPASMFVKGAQQAPKPQRAPSPDPVFGSRVAAPQYWMAGRPATAVAAGSTSLAARADVGPIGSYAAGPHISVMRWSPPACVSGGTSRAQSPAQAARSISPMDVRRISGSTQSRSLPRASLLPPDQQASSQPRTRSAGPLSPMHSHERVLRSGGVPVGDIGTLSAPAGVLSMDMWRAQAATGWPTGASTTCAAGQSEGVSRALTPHRTVTPVRVCATPQRIRSDANAGSISASTSLQWRPPAVGGSPVRALSPTPSAATSWQVVQEQQGSRLSPQRAQSPASRSKTPTVRQSPPAWAMQQQVPRNQYMH